jgi:hypothetical protein
VRGEHTVISDQRRVHRQGYSEQVSSEIINWQGGRDAHWLWWPAMMKVVGNRRGFSK